jgi:hypothetical protein
MPYYRDLFFATYGMGPWECYICKQLVYYGDQDIHHLDENQGNNDPKNLIATHKACHLKLHSMKYRSIFGYKSPSEETKRKMSEAQKRRYNNEKQNNKFGIIIGKKHTEETKKQISESMKQYCLNINIREERKMRGMKGAIKRWNLSPTHM